jgi:hypothetical protein
VHQAPVRARRGVIDRRPDQRVAERHPLTDPDQLFGLGGFRGFLLQAQAAGRRPQQVRIT